ncbi:MAG: hypothetical protein ACTIA5_01280 [Brachybacterium tyrofermentans]|uniref:hypothetical protein n=1 Tax=Brachybacterium tyrofermentans TaxID=47848 RepID=UPI003FB7A8D2
MNQLPQSDHSTMSLDQLEIELAEMRAAAGLPDGPSTFTVCHSEEADAEDRAWDQLGEGSQDLGGDEPA